MLKTNPKNFLGLILGFLVAGVLYFPVEVWALRDNPFDLPAGVRYKSQIEEVPKDLVLQAVIIGNEVRTATISNRNYQEQDYIAGRLIKQILPDRVILQEDAQEMVLELKRKPFAVKVRTPGQVSDTN